MHAMPAAKSIHPGIHLPEERAKNEIIIVLTNKGTFISLELVMMLGPDIPAANSAYPVPPQLFELT
jgi:hypothetical protein